ncbi:MAG TPA: hypothetical protein VF727_13985 [Allosphingosinicella sp.]|jgi:hypothetical protein
MRWFGVPWLVALALSLLPVSATAGSAPRGPQPQRIAVPPASALAVYDFDLELDPVGHRLDGRGTIDLPADGRRRDTVELELRAEFTLLAAAVRSGAGRATPATVLRAERGGQTIWTVRPPRPLPAGARVRLELSFSGGTAEGGRFLYIGPEVSFANASRESWVPRAVGFPSIGSLRFSVPPGLKVAAFGVRTSTSEQERAGNFAFRTRVPGDPWFAAGPFEVERRAGRYPAEIYLLKPRPGMAAYLDGCTRIIDVLSERFGAYPFGTFTLVELPVEITGRTGGFNALGSPGAILTSGAALDTPFNLAYFGHEIGHQWWGNVITRDPADGRGDYMMDEALADLGSLLAVEAIEGEAAAERYRRTGYPGFNPDSYSALGYLKLAAAGLDHPLSALPDSDLSFRLARSKGGRVWYALYREIGSERFPAVAAAVMRAHAFRPVTWSRFLPTISRSAGRDLGWFYSDYFDLPGAPAWHADRAGAGAKLVVSQPLPVFRGHIPVEIRRAGGAASVRIVDIRSAREELPVPEQVESIALDPRYTRLRWTPEYRAEAEALTAFTRARVAEGNEARLAILLPALAHVPAPDTYSVRYQLESFAGAILASERRWAEARDHLLAAVASPNPLPERLPLTWLRLATVAKELGDGALLRRAVAATVATDAAVGNVTGAGIQARELIAPADGK